MLRKGEISSALITEVDGLEKFYMKQVTEDRLGLYVSNKHPIASDGWSAIKKFGFGSLTQEEMAFPGILANFCVSMS